MSFAFKTAAKNIRRRPFRFLCTVLLVFIMSFSVFSGAISVISLQNGLSAYRSRLGADIIVVPYASVGHGSVDDILLQGITDNKYMSSKELKEIKNIAGIKQLTTQFYLTSAKASCCSSRVQIIGFDPETDFSVLPWIRESFKGGIDDGDLVVGANINVPSDKSVTFYGQEYNVAAQLDKTGTGLDSAVYANMDTVKEMAKNAARLLDTEAFRDVNINTAVSSVLITVDDGYDISDVADDINIHITKVNATQAKSMISGIAAGLESVSSVIGVMSAVISVLAVVIIAIVFAVLSNERKKEFAVYRVMGASKGMLFGMMFAELLSVCVTGALLGVFVGSAVMIPGSDMLKNMLELPVLTPPVYVCAGIALLTIVISVLTGTAIAHWYAAKITKSEAGLLLREDA